MPGPLVEVGDPWRHAVGVQQQAGDVDRRRAQLRCHAVGQHPERVVGRDEVAVPVDDHRRVGEVAVQDARQRGADRVELGSSNRVSWYPGA